MSREMRIRRPADRPVMVTLFSEVGLVVGIKYFESQAEALLRLPDLMADYEACGTVHISEIAVSIEFGARPS